MNNIVHLSIVLMKKAKQLCVLYFNAYLSINVSQGCPITTLYLIAKALKIYSFILNRTKCGKVEKGMSIFARLCIDYFRIQSNVEYT